MACRVQVPLQLAWAATIHSSQGHQYDRLQINLSECFAEGMAYTALSRVTSLAGLQVGPLCNPEFQSVCIADGEICVSSASRQRVLVCIAKMFLAYQCILLCRRVSICHMNGFVQTSCALLHFFGHVSQDLFCPSLLGQYPIQARIPFQNCCV